MTNKTGTVLFVDDEEKILKALRRLFRPEPYQTFFAPGGPAALDILNVENVSVVITDLSMHGMDGFTLLDRVKAEYPDIIRVVMSGHSDTDTILNAINQGNLYRYIVKPFNEAELKITTKQAVELFNLQQDKRNLMQRLEEHNNLLEERVEKRTKQLLAIEKKAEIGKHASQIVHNMNNPLMAVFGSIGIVELMMENANPDMDKLQKFLGIMKKNAYDLKKIIRSILDHAREGGRSRTEPVNINEIIARAIDFFELDSIFKYKIKKNISLTENLPFIKGDSIQIKQIMDNLIKNAIDAMEHSDKKCLDIRTGLENGDIIIKISDTGEGIAEEDLEKIFSSNYTTKPVGKGTGLGLASVKAMINAYSGKITVESENGKGTIFTVQLPV
jgi:signal transduction histidine kinase